MFKREHHVRIAAILQALDGPLLLHHECYFGGGTAIVLSQGEYRESMDIDFLISNRTGFRNLRQELTGEKGISAIVKPGSQLTLARDIRADQYGIRTLLSTGDVEIKFEIVLEARVSFNHPAPTDRICNVPTLTLIDMATSKILANSDRWTDDAVHSRDLIDLAMLPLTVKQLKIAKEKANQAYGESAARDLSKAIEKLKGRPARLSECMHALKMHSIPQAIVWNRIRSLR